MAVKFGFVPLLGLFIGVPALGAGYTSVPPASFLNYHVNDLSSLSQEVTLDHAVCHRLALHFHLTDAAMKDYIHRNLALAYLKETGIYEIACVRSNGTEYWVKEDLPKGTPIFVSGVTERPILKLACGNPMVSALPTARVATHSPAAPELAETFSQVQTALSTQPDLKSSADTMDMTLVADNAAGMIPATSLIPQVEVAGSLQSLGSASVTNLFPFAAGLAVLGLSSHGGNSGGSTPQSAPPTPVPEGTTLFSLMMLLLGGGGALALRQKSKRSTVK